MARLILSLFIVFSLTACAGKLNNNWLHNFVDGHDQPGKFDFDWQFSGASELLPLQVFDNGQKVWLQYPMDAVVPAIFASADDGDLLLNPERVGQFLVLNQVPDKIVIRGGMQKAEISRQSVTQETILNKKSGTSEYGAGEEIGKTESADLLSNVAFVSKPTKPTVSDKLAAVYGLDKIEKNKLSKAAKTKQIMPDYSVSPKDLNLRQALKTWAKNSEWTFNDEHWSVDVDIPIAGSASFGSSFQLAVRDLLSATELGDRPLQPCFYANKVLRVVPLAQRCDRTSAAGVSL